jgi:hypothetical protein
MTRLNRILGGATSRRAGASQWGLPVLLAACLAAGATAGCRSAPTQDPLQFASVVIHDQPHERVRDATAKVFVEHGYRVAKNGWADLVFEREGSTMNNLAYGTLMTGRVWVRVKVAIVEAMPGTCRLDGDAFVLRGRGEVLEEETKITKVHNRPYQDLLNEVAKRLKAENPGTVPPAPAKAGT